MVVNHLISTQQSSFSVTEGKTEGRKTNKQSATEGLVKQLKGGNSAFGDVYGFQTVTDRKGSSFKYKNNIYILYFITFSNYF